MPLELTSSWSARRSVMYTGRQALPGRPSLIGQGASPGQPAELSGPARHTRRYHSRPVATQSPSGRHSQGTAVRRHPAVSQPAGGNTITQWQAQPGHCRPVAARRYHSRPVATQSPSGRHSQGTAVRCHLAVSQPAGGNTITQWQAQPGHCRPVAARRYHSRPVATQSPSGRHSQGTAVRCHPAVSQPAGGNTVTQWQTQPGHSRPVSPGGITAGRWQHNHPVADTARAQPSGVTRRYHSRPVATQSPSGRHSQGTAVRWQYGGITAGRWQHGGWQYGTWQHGRSQLTGNTATAAEYHPGSSVRLGTQQMRSGTGPGDTGRAVRDPGK